MIAPVTIALHIDTELADEAAHDVFTFTSYGAETDVDSPDFNLDVAVDAVTWIDEHPEHWDQTAWLVKYASVDGEGRLNGEPPLACGTAGCLFGTVVIRAGAIPVWEGIGGGLSDDEPAVAPFVAIAGGRGQQRRVSEYATELLGLAVPDATLLSSAANSRHDIQLICTALAAGIGKTWPVPLPDWAEVPE